MTISIPITDVLFPANPPAGMDWSVIGLWVCRLRKTPDACDPPIEVTVVEGTEFYRISDGRHRFFGSMIAGRTHIDAVIV